MSNAIDGYRHFRQAVLVLFVPRILWCSPSSETPKFKLFAGSPHPLEWRGPLLSDIWQSELPRITLRRLTARADKFGRH
jgi:hypothetical protein